MVLDWFLWMAGGTTEREILEIVGIFEDLCGGTLDGYKGL